MAITREQARQQILDDLGVATERLALAVACLSEAYEQLSVDSADRLEAELFRPLQKAYGRAATTRERFARRSGVSAASALETPTAGLRSQGARLFVERAVALASEASAVIAQLQDSMLPIESGDAELREGLAEIRDLLDGLPGAARELLRTLGR